VSTRTINLDTVRSALEGHNLFLVYQPIVSLKDGSCFGAEALVRWRWDAETVLEASKFIPQLEHTPLAGKLTYWVIDTLAADLGEWLGNNARAQLSLNVPPEILGRGGVEYAVIKSGLSARARQLIIEVTERGIPDQLGLDALNAVPKTGARIALDDTELSGANLGLLTRCHFDFIKIDRSLVAELTAGKSSAPWLNGLTAVLKTTSLQIVAEGVETAFEAETLAAAGVQWAQGYYFSRPLSAGDFKRFYAATAGRPTLL
jgi:sensor c-di-GMP phosphodiesterase-like protein